jgi:hypothetical protein
MQKKCLLMIALAIFLCLFAPHTSAFAMTYYIAINGNDGNPGTLEKPFSTFAKGINALTAGDTLYVRGGIYNQPVYASKSGTASTPITISGYPGETAIIDGQYKLPAADWGDLFSVTGNYVVVQNLTVKNSNWLGLALRGEYSRAIKVRSEGNMETGILIAGNYSIVDSCEAYYNAKSNEFGHQVRSGNTWASGLSAARHPFYASIRKCKVWNNWGEGLSTFEAENSIIEDNVVWDNWGPNVYLSDTRYTILRRNLIYWTPGNPCSGNGGSGVGIMMGDERYNPPSSDNKIINNFVKGGNRCFYSWLGANGGGLINVLIAYNTFVNANADAEANFKILSGAHSNTQIINNIIEQNGSVPIISIDGSGGGLIFSHNFWSQKPAAKASGIGDLLGDPKLAKTGLIGPGTLSPGWFKIVVDSPARDRGKIIAEVAEDFFSTARGTSPDIGGHEYSEKGNSILTPPTNLHIVN